MALPEQIRKQTEAVQELYKQLNSADDNTGEAAPADGTVAPVEDAQATLQADATAANDAAPSSATEHKPGDDNVPEETIVQKYRTLQGMYNAEVPRHPCRRNSSSSKHLPNRLLPLSGLSPKKMLRSTGSRLM